MGAGPAAANRILDAYKLVTELSRLRAGHEVVISRNFASPADEYALRIKAVQRQNAHGRHRDPARGKADGDRRALVDSFAAKAAGCLAGQRLAQSGQHKEAVGLMGKNTAQMNRASRRWACRCSDQAARFSPARRAFWFFLPIATTMGCGRSWLTLFYLLGRGGHSMIFSAYSGVLAGGDSGLGRPGASRWGAVQSAPGTWGSCLALRRQASPRRPVRRPPGRPPFVPGRLHQVVQ